MPGERWRPAWAEIDVGAVRRNTSLLCTIAAPAGVCAVVKADGYGHGAVPVAHAALRGGATWLAVALVEEGAALREAGIEAPILLLSEPPGDAMGEAVARRLVPTVYSAECIRALAKVAAGSGLQPLGVHLKVDTGMHRVGTDPAGALALADLIGSEPGLRLDAVWTHLAVADGVDEPDVEFTRLQLARFDVVLTELARAGHRPALVHAANSAGAIGVPSARRDLVRCGIAIYGVAPAPATASQLTAASGGASLDPVLSLHSRVTVVRDLDPGERPSYGRRRPLATRSTVATVPIGYADGVPRRLFDQGAEVLIGGRRRPLAGTVTMDQIMVDCGPAGSSGVQVDDEVVLIGRQCTEEITADEWARLLGTISYEVLTGIGPRVLRVEVDRDTAG